jgi:adenosylcobinamide kinase/adenosylcobinamide-phosphate guanylyltransferase
MRIFLSGGAKNGKSSLAQELVVNLSRGGKRYYVATMIPVDEEDRLRIRRHVADRAGLGFETLEQGRDLPACLDRADTGGAFLLDSLTALLTNEMFHDGSVDPEAGARCVRDLTEFLGRVENAVVVSDSIYCDAGRYDEITELYRRSLAELDRAAAALCDTVVEMSAGQLIIHKGGLPE